MLRHYLSPDKNDSTYPSLQVHVLCGDGRLFTVFRQEMALHGLLQQPFPQFSTTIQNGYNAMKHANMFLFEAVGTEELRLQDTYTLAGVRGLKDEYKTPSEYSLQMPAREMRHWFRSPTGPCTLPFLIENSDSLAVEVVGVGSLYQRHLARVLRHEWNPYLAGMNIYIYIYF
jgi:hypothetical protein